MLTPAQRAVIEGSPHRRPRAGLIAGVEERRRALTAGMAPAHQVIWK